MQPVRILDPGLCKTCRYARAIVSDRKAVFWMCLAHKFDPRMAKYPELPVLACPVYQPDPDEEDHT